MEKYSEIIKTLVVEEKTRLDHVEIAKRIGFTKDEIDYIKKFWDPYFNESWIYLSKEIIKNQLVLEKSDRTVRNFYKQILLNGDYEEGEDYKEATIEEKNKIFKQMNLSGAKNKKRYFASGECYKLLLQKAMTPEGDKVRKYLIKIESLTWCVMKYIQEYEHKKTRQYKELLETWGEELPNVREMKSKRGRVYIMSTKEYAIKGKFKIESSPSIDEDNFNTESLVILYELESYNCKALESQVHRLLESFRCHDDQEFFKLPFLTIVDMLKIENESIERASVRINEFISTIYDQSPNPDNLFWRKGIDMSLFDKPESHASSKKYMEKKLSEIIASHIKNMFNIEEEDFDATLEELNESYVDLELKWWRLKPIIFQEFRLKPGDEITPYKKIVKEFSTKYKNIKFRWVNR